MACRPPWDMRDVECDVLIIGGGIVGVSIGACLSSAMSVALWEAEEVLGYHASGRSAALFEARYGTAPVIDLNLASKDRHEASGSLKARGLMLVGMAGEEDRFERDRLVMALADLSPSEARELWPILSGATIRAAYGSDAADLDTDAMQQSAVRTIRADGGVVETGQDVARIDRHELGWQVRSASDRVITCRLLVNAAGAWADRVAMMAGLQPIGLTPLRRSVARVSAPADHDVSGWPMMLGAGESWYAKPDAGAILISPADEDPSEPMDAWPEDLVLAEGLARYEAAVTSPVTRPIASWAGLRTFSPDRNPVLGRSPESSQFVWAAGLGGSGFQSAPAAASLVADSILGRAPDLPAQTIAALDPGRFA